MGEQLAKLYLELHHVVPAGTKTAHDLYIEGQIREALRYLDDATPRDRNGPCIKAADTLRAAIGLPPMTIPNGKPSDGVAGHFRRTARPTDEQEGSGD